MRKRWFLVLILWVFAFPASAKTLVFCSEGVPEGFDPAPFTSATTFDASSKVLYDRLVEFKPGTTEIIPGLARRWDISEDGREYVFHLKRGVKFHTTPYFAPNRDLTASDVKFSLERQRLADHPWHDYAAGGRWPFFMGLSMHRIIKDIVVIDDYTIKLVLSRAHAPVLANLAMDFASILSAEYAAQLKAEALEGNLNRLPVGTGPFQLVAFENDRIHFAAHNDYWGGRQPIDDLWFDITPNGAERLQKLAAGDCHVSSYPSPADWAVIDSNEDLKLVEQINLDISYLAFNTRIAPFDNLKMRQALDMAIDKKAIAEAVLGRAGIVAKSPLSPSMWVHGPDEQAKDYDPETAKQILQEEGIEGFEMEVWALPLQRSYNPNARRAAEIIRDNLALMGIDVRIVSYEWGEYFRRSRVLGRKGAVLLGWVSDNGDPDNVLGALLTCDKVEASNRAQWCNEEFDALLDAARTSANRQERTGLYQKALEIFQREKPWAVLTHSKSFVPMSKKIIGFIPTPFGGHEFTQVDIEVDIENGQ